MYKKKHNLYVVCKYLYGLACCFLLIDSSSIELSYANTDNYYSNLINKNGLIEQRSTVNNQIFKLVSVYYEYDMFSC